MLRSLNRRLSRADGWGALSVVELNFACASRRLTTNLRGGRSNRSGRASTQQLTTVQKVELFYGFCKEPTSLRGHLGSDVRGPRQHHLSFRAWVCLSFVADRDCLPTVSSNPRRSANIASR